MYPQASRLLWLVPLRGRPPALQISGVLARPRARRTGGEESPVARVGRSVRPVGRSAAPGSQRGAGAVLARPSRHSHWSQLRPPPGFRVSEPALRAEGAARRRRSLAAELRLRDERMLDGPRGGPAGRAPPPGPKCRVTPGAARRVQGGSSRSAPRASHLRALRGRSAP